MCDEPGEKSGQTVRVSTTRRRPRRELTPNARRSLRYTEDFFVKFDEGAVRISSSAAEDTFESSSR